MVAIPPTKDTDAEDVVWGLQTAEALWKRGERIDAIVWLRRAAQAAGEALDDDRALELARSAAELSDWMATLPAGASQMPPPVTTAATNAPPAGYDPHNASTFVPFGDDANRPPPQTRPNGPPNSAPESNSVTFDVDVDDGQSRPAPPKGHPPSSPTMQTAEPYFPPIAPPPPPLPLEARQQQPAPEDRDDEHQPRTTTSVPPAERVHAGMFNPWDDGAPGSAPIAPLPPPAPSFEEEGEVITSIRPQQFADQRADALAAAFTQKSRSEPAQPIQARADSKPSPPRPAPGRPPPLPPRALKPKAPRAPMAPMAPAVALTPVPPRMTPPPPSPTQVMAQPPPPQDAPAARHDGHAAHASPAEIAEEEQQHQEALALALGEAPALVIPLAQPTEPEALAVDPAEPSEPELTPDEDEPEAPAPDTPRSASPETELASAQAEEPAPEPEASPEPEPAPAPAEPPAAAAAIPTKLDLDAVEAFADLPDDARAAFAAAAEVSALGEGEEVSSFALAYIISGTVDVAATMVDAPAARLAAGAVLRSRGTTDDGVPMRLIGVDAGVVATWTDAEVEAAFRTCPWVEEDLRTAADRLQTLVGVTIGPLGERLDASIREQIIGRLTMRTLSAGEVVVTAGEQMPGLLLVGVGELELVDGDNVAGTVGSGEFLFPGEVLGGGDAPRTARAGAGGALILFGDRLIAQELLVTCPPLLEVFAGM